MQLLSTLKYKVNNVKTDWQGALVVATIFIGVIIFGYFRTLTVALIVLVVILIVLRLYFIPSGKLIFYHDGESFYCENHIKGDETQNRYKIVEKKFRWSYTHIETIRGNSDVQIKKSAVSLPLLRLELTFENGKELIICHEKGQWSSTPHWEYEIFDLEKHNDVLLTSSKLFDLKKEFDKLA
ncbi:MAG: hypothetical protein AB8F74_04010 [Saprospiraceae bacterium]